MLRVRIGLWGLLLGICLSIYGGMAFVNFLFDHTDVNLYVNSNTLDTSMANRLYSSSVDRLSFVQSSKENSSIIIEEESNILPSKYTTYTDYLYSPIVGFVCDSLYDHTEGFADLGNDAYKINLYDVLMGLNSGKEWQDLGINKKILTGKIQVVIPSENSPYYSYIRDLFAYTLTNKSVLEESDYTLADTILNKCVKVSDIHIRMKSDMDSKEFNEEHRSYFYIGPEFLVFNTNSDIYALNNKYGDAYMAVYFEKTTKLTLDVSIQKDNSNINLDELFISKNREDHSFSKLSGWRVSDGTVSRNYFANYVNCV